MKQNVSNQIPKCEGYNITAKQMLETVEDLFFVSQIESMSEVFAKVKEVSN